VKARVTILGLIPILIFALIPISKAADSLRSIKNQSFTFGESLTYHIHYGWFDVGFASVTVHEKLQQFKGRPCYSTEGTSKSAGVFEWIYKVRDHYKSYVDTAAIIPWKSYRKIHEGGWDYKEEFEFDHFTSEVERTDSLGNKKKFQVAKNMQDILSAFYYVRTIDFSNADSGDIFGIPEFFIEDTVYPLHFTFVGKEIVKTPVGKIAALKFKPLLQTGRIFSKKNDMTVWISDDMNKIPVHVKSKILVGSIKIDLLEYKGLRNKLAIVSESD